MYPTLSSESLPHNSPSLSSLFTPCAITCPTPTSSESESQSHFNTWHEAHRRSPWAFIFFRQQLCSLPQPLITEDTPMAPQILSSPNLKSLLDSVDTFLFDCDGVIWKGDTLIDGVSHTLDLLRSKGKNVVFVTNNSMRSRRQFAEKFQSLGLTSVTQDEIFSSSFAATMYLKGNNFPKDNKVYVIGGDNNSIILA